ncbi:hypothetical protein, partial [Massilia sp. TWP1-3-3]|uniref:hypothetical protein n=1 Tax=Massilia sp. TWP1-3-3 TaxID=2804573 RepID=UPI003CEC280A
MRHFTFPIPVASHPLRMSMSSLPTVLVALASLFERDVARYVGTRTAAVDLAMVAIGAHEHLDAASKARAKIESTNWCGIHRLAPCQADQEWTGRPTRAMGYLMHIPRSGFAGGAPVKTCEVLGWRRPRLFCTAKAVLPQPLSRALAPERTSRHHCPTNPDSLRQPRLFAASGARHAFGGIRSYRTKGRPARATAPAPTAELRQKAGEDRVIALELRFGSMAAGLAVWGREQFKSERAHRPTHTSDGALLETGHACGSAMNAPVKARFRRFCEAVH